VHHPATEDGVEGPEGDGSEDDQVADIALHGGPEAETTAGDEGDDTGKAQGGAADLRATHTLADDYHGQQPGAVSAMMVPPSAIGPSIGILGPTSPPVNWHMRMVARACLFMIIPPWLTHGLAKADFLSDTIVH
jgi:hypothetical protein